jgi:hypothetical protein
MVQTRTPLGRELPDGFEIMRRHNLIRLTPMNRILDGFALDEIIFFEVRYRRNNSPIPKEILPEEVMRTFAITTSLSEEVIHKIKRIPVSAGVYDLPIFSDAIRLIVLREFPKKPNNAMLHLFSDDEESVKYGLANYPRTKPETSMLLDQLWDRYVHDRDNLSRT